MINLIVTAGGKSLRFGNSNKLFAPCGTSCVLVEAIKPFLDFDQITKIIIGINNNDIDRLNLELSNANINDKRIVTSENGEERTFTVKNAINKLSDDCDLVLIHDGARPFVSKRIINEIIEGAKERGAAVPLVKLTDSLVSIENGIVPKDRELYRRVQTPAGFDRNRLEKAYSNCKKSFYDDISVVQEYSNGDVAIVEGDAKNIKITSKEDLLTPLVGIGYDIHRFKEGNGIKLLGTLIPCEFSFVAHSDGDVAIHALMDAILSAIGEKDIGHLFPVDDSKYDNADSIDLLNQVLIKLNNKGYRVNNISVSIIAEKPKLMPYIDIMKNNMSKILSIPVDNIGICATTNEQVGDLGSCKSIASFATISLLNK